MFVYVSFIATDDTLHGQSVYWFLIALGATLLPFVERLQFSDLSVEFRREIQRVEREILEVKGLLTQAATNLRAAEKDLTPEERARRDQHWDEYQNYMEQLSPPERFRAQRINSEFYLRTCGLDLSYVKQQLVDLGYSPGKIDDEFTQECAAAIEEFQRTNNMRHVDGMIGELTIRQLSDRVRDVSDGG
jgi:hypothetical protein